MLFIFLCSSFLFGTYVNARDVWENINSLPWNLEPNLILWLLTTWKTKGSPLSKTNFLKDWYLKITKPNPSYIVFAKEFLLFWNVFWNKEMIWETEQVQGALIKLGMYLLAIIQWDANTSLWQFRGTKMLKSLLSPLLSHRSLTLKWLILLIWPFQTFKYVIINICAFYINNMACICSRMLFSWHISLRLHCTETWSSIIFFYNVAWCHAV